MSFTVCFATGLWSHLQQNPPGWFDPIARPAGLYRFTQGIHVATGVAIDPAAARQALGRLPEAVRSDRSSPGSRRCSSASASIPLVGGGIFLLFTGFANINLWYPWPFNFRTSHYWVAWITIGALVVHIGAKFSTTRRDDHRRPPGVDAPPVAVERSTPDRRTFLGLGRRRRRACSTLFTVGQTVWPLRKLALLAPRRPDTGPQGFPVNRSAEAAGVVDAAQDPGISDSIVEGDVRTPLELSLDDLRALPQQPRVLPIACVEGWSASRDVARRARARPARTGRRAGRRPRPGAVAPTAARVRVVGSRSRRRRTIVDTLLALEVDGEPLHSTTATPLRLIGPNRPGVKQTKWVTRLVVS